MAKPGPEAGSDGAKRIGGFASKPGSAVEAGRKGGAAVKKLYGTPFYQAIGKKGGETVKRERGSEFFSEIGKKGGEERGRRRKERPSAA